MQVIENLKNLEKKAKECRCDGSHELGCPRAELELELVTHASHLIAVVEAAKAQEDAVCLCPKDLPPYGCDDWCERWLARMKLLDALMILENS